AADLPSVWRAADRPGTVPRGAPRSAAGAGHARANLRLAGRDDRESGAPARAHRGAAGQLPPAHRRQLEGWWHAARRRPGDLLDFAHDPSICGWLSDYLISPLWGERTKDEGQTVPCPPFRH